MDLENKKENPNRNPLIKIYINNKSSFEIVGFIGVLAALFLQIQIRDNEYLAYIQALLLILLIGGLTYLIYVVFKNLF